MAELGLAGAGYGGVAVTGLASDSREVRPGMLFAALPGVAAHGAEFAPKAVEAGAAAILTDAAGAARLKALELPRRVPVVVAADPREALAYAAALWFGAQPATLVAVTGTNGKTSVATFLRQIWEFMGLEAANIGTTGIEGAYAAPLQHTTPDPITLHRHLAAMAAAGVTHAAMEASSHGLAQMRLDAVRLAAAGFTNLSRDHLDYHGDEDAYFEAKAGLFERILPDDATAVVNAADPAGGRLESRLRSAGRRVMTVGRAPGNDLRLLGQRFDATGQEVLFELAGAPQGVRLELIGGFQAENALLAAGLAIAAGAAPDEVVRALPALRTVRGRMELAARRANGATVFVDYAHTPAAIETALQALRPHVLGRLFVIIGAGGDRDRGKRPLMGEAAARHADVVFVTDDNPRSEDPAAIRAAVMAGCPGATEIADRAEAILRAVDTLGPGDALLVAGKGHETGQVIGGTVFPFDDVEQASLAVAALEGRP
ncbi:MAG: UDP-N-acetylmuramoyl-L-alanyl-D-glutamate--2,6-diaminopimelate ligase [Alphaproteobacteria bacterium]|nr:MAG: UDP-N-acetylmuramoyl-L-alanyl-D-glutamate--2,6-diaminopimelate ligase [Alphaproteobacteria bacterium]